MMTNKNEAKTIIKHISYDYRCKFESTTCNSNQKSNNKICKCECKNYRVKLRCKEDYSWNPSKCIYENSKYLKRVTDTLLIMCDYIIFIIDIVTTKMKNTIATNFTNTSSKNCHSKKVRDCYILYTVLLAIILLLIITIIRYHYAKQRIIDALTILDGK